MKTVYTGQLVVAFVRQPGDVIRVVGEVKEVRAVVVDGYGVERIIELDKLEAAQVNDQRVYWMDRALTSESKLKKWIETNAAESAAKKEPN